MNNDYPYDKNETMKMLGQQTCPAFFNKDVKNDLQDIFHAFGNRYLDLEIVSCVFNLGVIYGKRDERAKKGGGNEYYRYVEKLG